MAGRMRKLVIFFALAAVLIGQAAAALPQQLLAVGMAVGIQMQTDGVVITGFDPAGSAAERAGLKVGDVICAVNGTPSSDAATLRNQVSDCDGTLVVQAARKGKQVEVLVHPARRADGYCLGVYIRDAIAGIGTVTYYDPESGKFGALGHGISDQATGQVLPLASGSLISASVAAVVQGQAGAPGQLQGAFQPGRSIGTVTKNTAGGIFGNLYVRPVGQMVPVAPKKAVTTGEATILCNVNGNTVESYTVEISRLYPTDAEGRNLLLKVTDARLLAQTGGIVQGMSGSPILQNGKLIGAVTHVLVNDPTRGYGILIENMLDAAA